MNKLTIIGNLTRDPELREVTVAGEYRKVCNYTVAVNRPRVQGKDTGADFFRVTQWDKRAETDAKYLHKGSKVCIVGPVSVRVYTDQAGQAHAQMEIRATEVEYLSKAEDAPGAPVAAPAPEPEQVRMDEQSGMPVVDVDDLPF